MSEKVQQFLRRVYSDPGLREYYEWFEFCMAKAGVKRKRGVVEEWKAGAEMWESMAWEAVELLEQHGVEVDDEIMTWLRQRAEEIQKTARIQGMQLSLTAFLEVRV